MEKVFIRDPELTHTGIITISDNNNNYNSLLNSSRGDIYDLSMLRPGDTFKTIIESDHLGNNDFSLSWEAGDVVVIADMLSNIGFPIEENWSIKGFITNWRWNEFTNQNRPLIDFPNTIPTIVTPSVWTQDDPAVNEFYAVGCPQWQKLRFNVASVTQGSGTNIKRGRQYKIAFDLEPKDGVLEGKINYRLFSESTSPDEHTPSISVDGGVDTGLTVSDAGHYEHIFDDRNEDLFSDSVSQSYPSTLYFQGNPTNNSGRPLFTGTIKNVEVELLDVDMAMVEIQVTAVKQTPLTTPPGDNALNFAVDLFTEEEGLFENKLPRFSYRYKYEDGEYSTFAPFTNVMFSPGIFRYNATEGYNAGMTNTIKKLTLGGNGIKDINYNRPENVVSIDILYKEEGSTAVYVVDTLKNEENVYEIKKETINGILPSNQMLRLWDNVPRYALSQEVVGNRIVYGNYTQNYDLNNFTLDLDVNIHSKEHYTKVGIPSVKSSREYQLGVVYSDKYGRETPVLTNSEATIRLDKVAGDEVNDIYVRINSDGHPLNMDYFKFYIKDTSGEYYNIAMDRYYDAEDGNVWLAFPSVDRNKIDIDDSIMLKKGIDSDSQATNKNKYKVVDIANEAPDFIKMDETLMTKKHHGSGNKLFEDTQIPTEDSDSFAVEASRYTNSAQQNLPSLFNARLTGVDYFIVISNSQTNRVTKRYKVVALEATDNSASWSFRIDEPFDSEILEFQNTINGGTEILNNTFFSIFKSEVINSPKFDGRFFVKILISGQDLLELDNRPVNATATEYVTNPNTTKKIYFAETDNSAPQSRKLKHATSVWLGYSGMDNAGDFTLGRSAVHPVNPAGTQTGNLADYWLTRKQIIAGIGDFDYDNGESSKLGYSQKYRGGTQMWWTAFFRGLNTETKQAYSLNSDYGRNDTIDLDVDNENNKFEDVWFISKTEGTKNWPIAEGFKINNGLPQGGTNSQTVWEGSLDDGWKQYSSSSHIYISFGGIEPEQWPDDPTARNSGGEYWDPSYFDLQSGNSNYAGTQGDFVKKLAAGSQFRFKEDPTNTIYSITDVNLFHKITYDNLQETNQDSPPTNVNHFKGQVRVLLGQDTGHNVENNITYASSSFFSASNFMITYKLSLDKAAVWNPVEGVDTAINAGVSITIPASADPTVDKTGGSATIEIGQIDGVDQDGNNTSIETGMVLDKYSSTDLVEKAVVHKIEGPNNAGKYTIFFKAYDGADGAGVEHDLNGGTSAGNFGHIATTDTLRFRQYCMNGLSPNLAKNINYFNDGGLSKNKTGVTPVGYTIEFVDLTTSIEKDNPMSTNPAVWETEPKENKDLDIYYEASSYHPIIESSLKLADFIQVGALVEHVGSNTIDPSTVISSINSSGQVTLSNNIQITKTLPPYRTSQFDN